MTCEACYFPKDECRCFSRVTRGERLSPEAVRKLQAHAEARYLALTGRLSYVVFKPRPIN